MPPWLAEARSLLVAMSPHARNFTLASTCHTEISVEKKNKKKKKKGEGKECNHSNLINVMCKF